MTEEATDEVTYDALRKANLDFRPKHLDWDAIEKIRKYRKYRGWISED